MSKSQLRSQYQLVGVDGSFFQCLSIYKSNPIWNLFSGLLQNDVNKETETTNPPWICSLPHVLVATISSFLFGYHLGFVIIYSLFEFSIIIVTCTDFLQRLFCHRVVNEPLESISSDLGFSGDTLAEGVYITSDFYFSCRISH